MLFTALGQKITHQKTSACVRLTVALLKHFGCNVDPRAVTRWLERNPELLP
jgi:hypothetical protein